MADVNKSELVRQILKETPGIAVKDVVTKMAAKGHKITPNLVYFIKGKTKGAKGRKHRIVKAAMAATPLSTIIGNGVVARAEAKADAITVIREVKALAAKVGGYQKLKDLVDALAE
jgi:hypothetical protein